MENILKPVENTRELRNMLTFAGIRGYRPQQIFSRNIAPKKKKSVWEEYFWLGNVKIFKNT